MIGKTVSHFTIEYEIGSGGMGTVYLARDTNLGREVALKLLQPKLTRDNTNQARFRQEARAMAAINHPRIATVYEVGEFEQSWYIAMEYIQGKTLQELMQSKQFSTEKILGIIIQLCEGLSAAHDKDIYHRDIKPGNLIINDQGQLKIVDFGLAKLRIAGVSTSKSATLGTLFYLSPEQINNRKIDQRTDIFSTGIILYQLLTGELPFRGEHEASVMYAILNESPEPLKNFRKDLGENLQDIISKALHKDPEQRYLHINELGKDLKQELTSGGVITSSAKRVLKKDTRSKRKLAAIMFIDIVGYSRMMGKDEDEAFKLLEDYDRIVSPLIEQYYGMILKKIGDGLFCEFSSAIDSAECALAIQAGLNKYNQSSTYEYQLLVRIGIHVGDVIKKDDDLFGDGVNVAARIEPLAPAGGIYISDSVHSAVSNHPRFSIKELGLHNLKNIKKQHNLYQILTGFETQQPALPAAAQSASFTRSQEIRTAALMKNRKGFLSPKVLWPAIATVIVILAVIFYEPVITVLSSTGDNSSPEPAATEGEQSNITNQQRTEVNAIIGTEKPQKLISEITQFQTTELLLQYLQRNREQGQLTFGRRDDFFDQQGKYVIILDEQKIYSILFYYKSRYFDTATDQVYSDLSQSFKGKRNIWVELL